MGAGKRGRSSSRDHRQRGGKGMDRPPCPPSFACHVCDGNHWTIECLRVRNNPQKYPKIDLRHGCWQCGGSGHEVKKCPVKRHRCTECGAYHDTPGCPYTHTAQEWHEFFDEEKKHVFYCNSTSQAVQWEPPHALDVVMWYCSACNHLLPASVSECVSCHKQRPVSQPLSSDDETDTENEDRNGLNMIDSSRVVEEA